MFATFDQPLLEAAAIKRHTDISASSCYHFACFSKIQNRYVSVYQSKTYRIVVHTRDHRTGSKRFQQLCKGDVVPYEFENLWRARNIIWNFVDRRIARIYKLPSLAVNISLPSPPIGDQILSVPDAPWMASNLDLDLLIKEEIGMGCQNFTPILTLFVKTGTNPLEPTLSMSHKL